MVDDYKMLKGFYSNITHSSIILNRRDTNELFLSPCPKYPCDSTDSIKIECSLSVGHEFDPRPGPTKDIKDGTCYFPAKHSAFQG